MKTIRRLIYGEILNAVTLVSFGFLALFFFFDFTEEIQAIGRYSKVGYGILPALTFVTLLIPTHLYELLPIAVLIGTIFVMARMAQNSEYTILRTSGLNPGRALKTLLLLGLGLVLLTFLVGDYVAPLADRTAQLLKARYQGHLTVGQTGAWLKERQGDARYAVNVGALESDGHMHSVRVFEFDAQGSLRSMMQAQSADFSDGAWILNRVERTVLPLPSSQGTSIGQQHLEKFRWPNQISDQMLAAALLKPERMKTIDLYQYIAHLNANAQNSQRYEIEFWKKVFYPLSCLVMVVLALPFAYLHFRSGSIASHVFGGVMVGISFFLLNNVFGYVGNLQNWQPWVTAALPGLIYSLLSLSALGWLVFR